MKKLTTVLLAVCLLLQPCAAWPIQVFGADSRNGVHRAAKTAGMPAQAAAPQVESILEVNVQPSPLFPYEGKFSNISQERGQKYYYKMRAYVTDVDGGRIYGKFSEVGYYSRARNAHKLRIP